MLWAPAHSRGRVAQDGTRHRSCLLLSESVWPHDPVCGAGMAPAILCGALWVLHGPAALLQVLHGSVPLAVAPAWMHSADCGSCTAPQTWVQALHGPAWPHRGKCGSCVAPQHHLWVLHGPVALGTDPARP